MKQTLTFILAVFLTASVSAQTKFKTPSSYDVVVSFGSMCCGTVSDDFLKAHYKKFTKQNKVTIPAYKSSGCGKEGEYKVMFSLSKMKKTVRTKYLAELKTMIAKQEKKNRAKDSSSGTINLDYKVQAEDIGYCRGGVTKW